MFQIPGYCRRAQKEIIECFGGIETIFEGGLRMDVLRQDLFLGTPPSEAELRRVNFGSPYFALTVTLTVVFPALLWSTAKFGEARRERA